MRGTARQDRGAAAQEGFSRQIGTAALTRGWGGSRPGRVEADIGRHRTSLKVCFSSLTICGAPHGCPPPSPHPAPASWVASPRGFPACSATFHTCAPLEAPLPLSRRTTPSATPLSLSSSIFAFWFSPSRFRDAVLLPPSLSTVETFLSFSPSSLFRCLFHVHRLRSHGPASPHPIRTATSFIVFSSPFFVCGSECAQDPAVLEAPYGSTGSASTIQRG